MHGNGYRNRRDGHRVDGVAVVRQAYFGNSIYVWRRMISVVMLKQGGGPAWVQELAQRAATEMVEFLPGARAVIFTDDRAPIEEISRRMLLASKNP